MKDNFIILTSTEGHQVIIGITNIAMIQKEESFENTTVYLNFLNKGNQSNYYPYRLEVKESFEEIKDQLGF